MGNVNPVSQLATQNARLYPEAIAVRFEGREWTFAEYAYRIDRLAHGLVSLGISQGSRIAILARNCAEYLVAYGTAEKLGCVLCPINIRWTEREIDAVLERLNADALIFEAEFRSAVERHTNRTVCHRHR